MTSTNKTPNLGLCQWVETDPVLREDFNNDNAKIDAAVAAAMYGNMWFKLRDIKTTEAAHQINIAIGDIDVTKYRRLQITLESDTSGTSEKLTFGFLPAPASAVYNTTTYYSNVNCYNTATGGVLMAFDEYGDMTRTIDVLFSLYKNKLKVYTDSLGNVAYHMVFYSRGIAEYSSIVQPTELFFKRGATVNTFSAGTCISIYGLLR